MEIFRMARSWSPKLRQHAWGPQKGTKLHNTGGYQPRFTEGGLVKRHGRHLFCLLEQTLNK